MSARVARSVSEWGTRVPAYPRTAYLRTACSISSCSPGASSRSWRCSSPARCRRRHSWPKSRPLTPAIVYIDASLSFLAPYATQTILNALAFHKKLFQLTPSEKTTVLILDFQDYGNAWATSIPRNTVQIQVAPLTFLFETLPGTERLLMIANHEMVHVATMDGAAGRDLAFRKLFFGKVNPIDEQPESILYFYLTSPRVAAPRWYAEGIAVFIDTWMSAGIGRAQSGYDEMVFRAMVKDKARFYDPLGLASEGTKIDFQVEVNSYLYGTRFMTYLAYQYSPDKLIEWTSRHPGSKPYYASQFRKVFGKSLEAVWADWIAFETAVPGSEPRRDPQDAGDAGHRRLAARARLDLARLLRRSRPAASTPPSTTRASSRTSARSRRRPAPSST